MTIIEFKPSSWEGNTSKTSQHHQQPRYSTPQYECDCCEFVDYEIVDEEYQGFFSKIKGFFKKEPEIKNTLTDKEAFHRARNVMCNSIVERNDVFTILQKTTCKDQKRYLWELFNSGIDVSFEEDNLGRGVMVEKDLEGNLKRITTFYNNNLEIVSIEKPSKRGRGWDKISFFDSHGAHFEVKKGMTSRSKMKEFYSFEDGYPSIYRRNCTVTSTGIVGKEEYIF